MKFNQKLKNRVIDKYCTFSYLLQYSDYGNYKNLHCYSGTMFCPFHDNFDTPSARLYQKTESQECEQIYCFSENRLYRPHDCCKDYSNLIKYDTNTVFSVIWSHLSETEKKMFDTENSIGGSVLFGYDDLFKKYRCAEVDLFHVINCLFHQK